MEKLPSTSQRSKRNNSDKSQTLLAAATDRKIRYIIENRKSGSFIDPKYIHTPQNKLLITDATEITSQLSLLRSCMDKERLSFTRGDARLIRLKSEDSKIQDVISKRKFVIENLTFCVKETEQQIERTLIQQNFEEDSQEVYSHVLDRMRTTLVFLKRKFYKLEQSLRLSSIQLSQSMFKSIKSKEQKSNIFQAFSILQQEMSFELESKQKEIEKVDSEVVKQKALMEDRIAHRRMQEDLREQAVIEDHSSQLEGLREKYLLHFMWHRASTVRFESEKVKWKRYEEAFLRIKLATGISSIPVLVEKYLTKEQIYFEFIEVVKNKEKELTGYQEKIEKIQKNIEKLNEDETVGIDKNRFDDLIGIRKVVFEENLKMKQLAIVQDKIKDWCKRFVKKISTVAQGQEVDLDGDLRSCVLGVRNVVSGAMRGFREDKERFKTVHLVVENSKMGKMLESPALEGKAKGRTVGKLRTSELSFVDRGEESSRKHK